MVMDNYIIIAKIICLLDVLIDAVLQIMMIQETLTVVDLDF